MAAEQTQSYNYISGVATTVVKASSGVLKSIAITSLATAGIIALYDNASAASGAVIASIGIAGVAAAGGFQPYTIDFNGVAFANGLVVKTSGKAQNLTVSFR